MQSMMPGQTAPKDTARSAASVYARGCFAGSRLVSCTARSHGRTSAASAPVHAEGKYASAGVLSAGRVSGVPCSVQCSAVSDSVTNAFSDSLAPELPASAIREPSNGRVKISVLSSKQQAGSSAAVAEPELVASQLSVPFPVIQSYPKWGNLRIYDVSSYVNMQELAAACERLKVDPYVHEGFRRKHINWFDRVDPSALSPTHSHGSTTATSSTDPSDALAAVHAVGYEPLAEQTLFQRKHFNPTHGGLARVYAPILDCLSPDPETMPGTGASPDLVASLLSAFTLASNAPAKARILLQLQRVTATPDMPGQPSVENWHRDGVNTIGIICVSRRDVEGGVSEFRAEVDNEVLSLHLAPGQLAVFEDAGVMHRVTEIACAPGAVDGARDVVLIAF